ALMGVFTQAHIVWKQGAHLGTVQRLGINLRHIDAGRHHAQKAAGQMAAHNRAQGLVNTPLLHGDKTLAHQINRRPHIQPLVHFLVLWYINAELQDWPSASGVVIWRLKVSLSVLEPQNSTPPRCPARCLRKGTIKAAVATGQAGSVAILNSLNRKCMPARIWSSLTVTRVSILS